MPRYYVVTPEYECYSQTEIEPAEYGADVIEVEAPNKREAIKAGVKAMLKGNPREFKWCRQQRSEKASPYAGVKAHLFEAEAASKKGDDDGDE